MSWWNDAPGAMFTAHGGIALGILAVPAVRLTGIVGALLIVVALIAVVRIGAAMDGVL